MFRTTVTNAGALGFEAQRRVDNEAALDGGAATSDGTEVAVGDVGHTVCDAVAAAASHSSHAPRSAVWVKNRPSSPAVARASPSEECWSVWDTPHTAQQSDNRQRPSCGKYTRLAANVQIEGSVGRAQPARQNSALKNPTSKLTLCPTKTRPAKTLAMNGAVSANNGA